MRIFGNQKPMRVIAVIWALIKVFVRHGNIQVTASSIGRPYGVPYLTVEAIDDGTKIVCLEAD